MVKQGDIINVQLNPTQCHEQQGYRPCVCLSHDIVYKYSKIIIVAPISNTQRNYSLYFNLIGYKTTDQINAMDPNARKVNLIEELNNNDLKDVLKISIFTFQE